MSITGAFFVLPSYLTRVCSDTNDQLVQIDAWAVLIGIVGVDVKVPHTNFTEVAGMVFVEVDAMVMLTTSVTATSRMFPMLANTAMTMGHMSTKLPGLLLVSTHGSFFYECWKRKAPCCLLLSPC